MANHDFTYDVFLSFRGESGTRYAFTDHLYQALLRHGINTFRDDQKLKIGDEIGPSLLHAIEASRISIVVLCKNYAFSTWCLDELSKIIDCYENEGKPVSVIFYKVEPSDVRYQRNSYEAAMIKHGNRYGQHSEKVKAWRSALFRACSLSGQHCRDDIYETVFIEKIVKDISAKLPPMPLQTKHLVGLDSRFEKVKSLIDIDSSDAVCMLGIYGVGGVGKTTFALDIYNKIRHRFEAASFLANVREKSNESINGLEHLQRTLLSEMGEETQTMMGSTFRATSEIKSKLGQKRILLILDDVDSVKQLESLAGGRDWFGSGSRIIITTRDADVLHKHNVEIKYKLEQLNDHESLELFCCYAFNMSGPVEHFSNISSRAISYAKGIPLALRVIGSNLKGRSIEEWDIELQKYRKVPDAEIQGVLAISYNSLSELDQKTFLDIACFFKGERWKYVERILKACDFYPSIQRFIMKSLINVDENGCLDMHDLIQDMGREVVRKESPSNPGDRSRLWSHNEVFEVLKENLGSTTVEGIILHPPKQEKVDHWAHTAFVEMKNLRILIVRNTIFSSGPSYLPNSLRLLDWKGYPSKTFPPNFYPRRIVDFKLPHSSLILKKPCQTFEDLTFINLSQCQSITQIPNLSGAKNLIVFRVDKCHKLVKFDKSIGFMPNLVYLNASGCSVLKSFVPTMYLPSLQVLSFNFCKKFEHFPHVMQKMDKPIRIHLINTAVKDFPKSIGNLTGLEYIDMSICKGLRDLSSSFLLLPKLVTLKINGCTQLGESFKRFKNRHSVANGYPNLVTLHFSEANLSYEDLNVIIEIFPKLEDLIVSQNRFETLPKRIRGSLHLKSLDVSVCKKLTKVPELPLSIQKIDARHCQSLTSEALSMLWSKVKQEIKRIQVVMPMLKREIPKWFDCVFTQDVPLMPMLEREIPEWFDSVRTHIPHFWARRKFPVFALALVFQEVIKTDAVDTMKLLTEVFVWHTVSLHLFIDGQEICATNYHCFKVVADHVLLCDLRVLFSDEEWQNLDASIGDDWKAIQVQYVSDMILSNWGVYVYRQETNMDDFQCTPPNPNSLPLSCLVVPKGFPEQKMKHMMENFEGDIFDQDLPLLESEEVPVSSSVRIIKMQLESLRIAEAEIIEEASSSAYGTSLRQEHEESAEDFVQVFEMMKESIPKQFVDSYPEMDEYFERAMRAVESMTKNRLDMCLPIILEYTDTVGAKIRRFWGQLEIKLGNTFYKPVLRRVNQLSWGRRTINLPVGPVLQFEDLWESAVLLKCQHPASQEASSSCLEESSDEGYYDPELEELMRRIEQDAMSLNKSFGKMKASIIQSNDPFSKDYLFEVLIFKRLFVLGKLTTFGSLTKFKITPYGVMRAADDAFRTLKICFWGLMLVLPVLFIGSSLFFLLKNIGSSDPFVVYPFVVYMVLYLYRQPTIRKLLVWGNYNTTTLYLLCSKEARTDIHQPHPDFFLRTFKIDADWLRR